MCACSRYSKNQRQQQVTHRQHIFQSETVSSMSSTLMLGATSARTEGPSRRSLDESVFDEVGRRKPAARRRHHSFYVREAPCEAGRLPNTLIKEGSQWISLTGTESDHRRLSNELACPSTSTDCPAEAPCAPEGEQLLTNTWTY